MRRFLLCAPVLMAVVGTAVLAQSKVTTPEEHASVMKSNAQAVGATNKALGAGAFADARPQIATLRQNFTALQAFWAKRDDAAGILKDGLARLDAVDKILAAPAPDQTAAQGAVKEFAGATCGACHKAYREGDAQSGFKFKAGVI
jgi:cytochrome c556